MSSSLNQKHALIECLLEWIELVPSKYVVEKVQEILEFSFILINDLPDVIVVSTYKLCEKLS